MGRESVKSPPLLLVLLASLLPFQLYVNIGSLPLASGYIIVSLFILSTVLLVLRWRRIVVPRLLRFLALFLVAIGLSFAFTVDRVSFLIQASQVLFYTFFYWAVVNRIRTTRQIDIIVKLVLVSGLLSGLLGIGQFLVATLADPGVVIDLFFHRFGSAVFGVRGMQRIGAASGIGYFFRSSLAGVGAPFRAFGLFGGGNSFGFYHALLYAFSLEQLTRKRGWWRSPGAATLLVLAIAVFLSWSRMAWLMVFVATVYRFSVFKSNLLFFAVSVGLAIMVVILLASILRSWPLASAVLATVSRSDWSTITRLQSMKRGLEIWRGSPWIGRGLEAWPKSGIWLVPAV